MKKGRRGAKKQCQEFVSKLHLLFLPLNINNHFFTFCKIILNNFKVYFDYFDLIF